MFLPSKAALEKCPKCMRYLFYILSSLKIQRFATWEKAGEPNPFVRQTRTARSATHRQEIVDLFEDTLGRR